MKKVLTVLLAATGILAFSACGGNSVKSQTAPPDVNSTQSAPTAQAAPATQATTEAQANDEVSITDNGVTFVLPKGFRTYNDKIPAGSGITTMVASPTERIAFCAIREEKSPFEGSEITSVEAYLQFQHDNSKGKNVTAIKNETGIPYFEYEYTNGNQTFRYFTTAMESDSAYYTLQCFTPVDEYDSYKDRILNGMRNVRVE